MIPSTGLRDDDRGAILVVGLFMAVALASALWFGMGLAEAVLYRERVQDNSDTSAVAAAVVHAKGMNVIGAMNVTMGAITGVSQAVKGSELVNTTANILMCSFTSSNKDNIPLCSFTSGLRGSLAGKSAALEGMMRQDVATLSKAQIAMATAAPAAAVARTTASPQDYKPTIARAVMLGPSLAKASGNKKIQGLPIQEEPFKTLCKINAGINYGLVMRPFRSAPSMGFIHEVAGEVLNRFPPCDTRASSRQESPKSYAEAKCLEVARRGPKGWYFDRELAQCKSNLNRVLQQLVSHNRGTLGVDPQGRTPKRVFEQAENGNGYFQLWTTVRGEMSPQTRSDRGVELGAWGKAKVVAPDNDLAFSAAEYYYDTTRDWNGAERNVLTGAWWNMRWRARLRRSRPADALATMDPGDSRATEAVFESRANALGSKGKWGRALMSDGSHAYLMAKEVIQRTVGSTSSGAGNIDSMALKNAAPGFVH